MSTLLSRARDRGTPLLDRDAATFVWEGERAPELIGDFNGFGWREPHYPLSEDSPGVWACTLSLPPDAYLEYVFRIDGSRTLDPLNPRSVNNGTGARNNYFFMPEGIDTPLVRVPRGVPRGVITRHVLQHNFRLVSRTRTVHLYQPPVSEPTPLLLVFDGQDYLRRARLSQIVDNLIAQRRIRPLALAFVEHGRSARYMEYDCSEATLGWLIECVLPLAHARLNLLDWADHPGCHGVLGASMGGLMALYTGLRLPNIFGHVFSQSGAFLFELAGNPPVIFDLVRGDPVRPLTVCLQVGAYEHLLESNRQMHAALLAREYQVTYREYPGGHNFTSWRRDLWRGLEALYE